MTSFRKEWRIHLKIVVILFGVLLTTYVVTTVYFLAYKNTSESYSLQQWSEYYGLENWNLAKHAIADIDGDGATDIVTFTGCAFLSSVRQEQIQAEKQCQEPGMSALVFPESTIIVGQKITSEESRSSFALEQSFLVKTKSSEWKYYELHGMKVAVHLLEKNKMFKEITPAFIDRVDAIIYFINHVGVAFVLFISSVVIRGM